MFAIAFDLVVADTAQHHPKGVSQTCTPRRKSEPSWTSHATSGLPFIVQRNGFAIVALK